MSNTSNTNNDFLPTNYEIPSADDGYFNIKKQTEGDYRFRIMGSPVLGNEFWITLGNEGGKPKKSPVRRRMNENIETSELEEGEEIHHFWAYVIWNYGAKKIQIMEITQKGIMQGIKGYTRKEKWGSPVGTNGYDIVVTKTGAGMETRYAVTVEPKEKLTPEIMKAYDTTTVNLEALFSNDDPFKVGGEGKELNIDNFDPDSMD